MADSRAPSVPPMDLEQSSLGPIGVLAKRSVDALLRYHTHYQGELNVAFSRFMLELEERDAAQERRIEEQANKLREQSRLLDEVRTDTRELYGRTDALDPARAEAVTVGIQQFHNLVGIVAGIDQRVVDLSSARAESAADSAVLALIRDQVVSVEATVGRLHNQVAMVEKTVDEFRRDVATFRDRLRALQSHVAALHETIGGLQNHISELQEYTWPSQDAGLVHNSSSAIKE